MSNFRFWDLLSTSKNIKHFNLKLNMLSANGINSLLATINFLTYNSLKRNCTKNNIPLTLLDETIITVINRSNSYEFMKFMRYNDDLIKLFVKPNISFLKDKLIAEYSSNKLTKKDLVNFCNLIPEVTNDLIISNVEEALNDKSVGNDFYFLRKYLSILPISESIRLIYQKRLIQWEAQLLLQKL